MASKNIFDCKINDLFEKKFLFNQQTNWILPSSILKEDCTWTIDSLTNHKINLNAVKSRLNDKGEDWHEHTLKINKAALVINTIKSIIVPEVLTQAWCKFFEIISNFDLVSNKQRLQSLHLCEAPGGFISALNYYLCVNYPTITWDWVANTLNPYYEGHNIRSVVVDDRLILPTLKQWFFGEDNTGDITDASYIEDLCNRSTEAGLFDLITADGSIDCLDNPGEQELVVEKLHFAEILVALTCLAPQGCFVLKRFTFFESSTISQLYLLNCIFEKVHVFKPFTSRPSNSEVYVICIGFQGSEQLSNILLQFKDLYCTNHTVAAFSKSSIPESFFQQLIDCSDFFTSLQIKAIEENLMLYANQNEQCSEKLNSLQKVCADEFVKKFGIHYSDIYDSFKLFKPRKKVITNFSNEHCKNHKILYFQAVGDTFNNIVQSTSITWHDKILDVETRISMCFPTSRKRLLEAPDWYFPWKEIRKRITNKSMKNWITLGKKFSNVQNSKFCYPILLHLWNKISLDNKVQIHSHLKEVFCWNHDILDYIFNEKESPISRNIVNMCVSESSIIKDSFLSHLEQNLNFEVKSCFKLDVDREKNFELENKTIYMNMSLWNISLHNESLIKNIVTNGIYLALKNLKKGDSLILCFQSLLTRYTVGLIFLIISLFEKFITILPEEGAPANYGQIWIFKNFEEDTKSNNVIQYLMSITELNSSQKEVLEIVPLLFLCDGPFYKYIKELNNKSLLQRVKSLISVEKLIAEKSF